MKNPQIEILNAIGQKVLVTIITSAKNHAFSLDISPLHQGVCFLKIGNSNQQGHYSFVKN